MGDASRFINEHTHYRVAFRTGNFGVDQFNSIVESSLFGYLGKPSLPCPR